MASAALLQACARAAPAGPPLPPDESAALAAELAKATRIMEPTQIRFDWSLEERGAGPSGRGVTRIEPPYRARLDLFLGDGTTAGRAMLLDGALWVPSTLPDGVIPPPDLLWAALGVFRPGRESALLGARRSDGEVELRYASTGGRELRYTIVGERIERAELLQGGRTEHRVTLASGDPERFPREATYRNLEAFRQLKLTTRSIEHVASFPADIWFPEP